MKKGNNEGSIKKNIHELEEIDEDDENFSMTNLVEGAVKTPKGYREIPIPQSIWAKLLRHRELQRAYEKKSVKSQQTVVK